MTRSVLSMGNPWQPFRGKKWSKKPVTRIFCCAGLSHPNSHLRELWQQSLKYRLEHHGGLSTWTCHLMLLLPSLSHRHFPALAIGKWSLWSPAPSRLGSAICGRIVQATANIGSACENRLLPGFPSIGFRSLTTSSVQLDHVHLPHILSPAPLRIFPYFG